MCLHGSVLLPSTFQYCFIFTFILVLKQYVNVSISKCNISYV